jgi:hypothetical protein
LCPLGVVSACAGAATNRAVATPRATLLTLIAQTPGPGGSCPVWNARRKKTQPRRFFAV